MEGQDTIEVSMADDDADDGRDTDHVLDVWVCNLDAVGVFQLCPVAGIGHMGGIHWTGIDSAAIRAACLLLRMPRRRWPDLARDVAYMGDCVAQHRNREAAARAKRRE